MDATVKGTFWTDSRVEELDMNHKLAALWLITNPARTLLGFTHTTARRFLLDTCLPFHTLEGVCKALPSSFEALGEGWFFTRNFLRHQFGGKGGQVSPLNKVIVSAIRQAKALPSPLQGAFLNAYPELSESVLSAPSKTSPFEGGPQGVITTSTSTTGETETSLGKGVQGETTKLVEEILAAYPRREATAECMGLVYGQIRSGIAAADILAGTKAIAAAIAQLPSGSANAYVLGAPRFFREKRWQDDPATWLRQATRASDSPRGGKREMSQAEIDAALGGRA